MASDPTLRTGSSPPVATLLGERYRLETVIGSGGAANVFEATDLRSGQSVAVKVLARTGHWNPELLARFQREVSVTAAISSPHVVHVLDAGWDAAFGIYLVMERLRGMDLRQYLAVHGRMHPRAALQMASEVALGLAAAHAVGVVHRDLKPSNIYLSEGPAGDVVVKVVDFGIAKVFVEGGVGDGSRNLTLPGTAIGTPQYMAPEQLRSPESVTPATDTYALGAVLFEALVGEPVIRAGRSYAQMLVDVLSQPTPRLNERFPDADASLDDVVTAMMRSDAAEGRPAMGVLAQRLAWLASTELSWSASRAPVLPGRLGAAPGVDALPAPLRRGTLSKVAIAAGAAAIAVGVAAVTSDALSAEPASARAPHVGVEIAE